MNRLLSASFCALMLTTPALAGGKLIEPRLTLPATARQQPHVALTLDACSGKADDRILNALVANNIPATVFVTARWLKRNSAELRLMLAHPDLFEIENHGARHLPALDRPGTVFGLPGAGSPEAVKKEVDDGAAAVLAATGKAPLWYRGATGRYTPSALALIIAQGEAVAGYSLIADDGALLPKSGVMKRIARANDGDVIIAHVNHPEKPAGEGVVEGILALKRSGYTFVKLGPPHPRETATRHGA